LRSSISRRCQRAQIFLLFAISLPVLMAFAGLAIDLGFAFLTRANLSKAVDAAALAAMRNYSLGQTQATAIAQSVFNTNYGSGFGRDSAPPVLNISLSTDANNNAVVNVNATVSINTFFLRVLSGLNTLQIASNAQATRPKLIMSLVLDKSGSMNKNGGAQALPPAVDNFLTYFDNNTDEVADVSFSSVASVDVPRRHRRDLNLLPTQKFEPRIPRLGEASILCVGRRPTLAHATRIAPLIIPRVNIRTS